MQKIYDQNEEKIKQIGVKLINLILILILVTISIQLIRKILCNIFKSCRKSEADNQLARTNRTNRENDSQLFI